MKSSSFGDVEKFFSDIEDEVLEQEKNVGEKAVLYAKENGTYHDVTGNLRSSSIYEATPKGLVIRNTAFYASKVEAEGKDVISGATLYAENLLKNIFEK